MWEIPSAAAIRHISTATSQDLGPSSTSGRMWLWMSITRGIPESALNLILNGFNGKDQAAQAFWNLLQPRGSQAPRPRPVPMHRAISLDMGRKTRETREPGHKRRHLLPNLRSPVINAPDAFEPLHRRTTGISPFTIEHSIEQSDGKPHPVIGGRSTACAAGVLQKLAGREAQQWAQGGAEAGDTEWDRSSEAQAGELWRLIEALVWALSARAARRGVPGSRV